MKIDDLSWAVTSTENFRLAVNTELPVGSEMSFAGASGGGYVNGIWKPGTVKLWISSYGTWERVAVFPESDQSIIEECEADPSLLFPDEAFTPLDHVLNDVDSLAIDYAANEIKWQWESSKVVHPEITDVLNNHVMKYPFSQTVTQEADIACLVVNAEPHEAGALWGSSVVSTEVEDVQVINRGSECWMVSLFEDMQTTDGTTIERGKFYKLTADVNLSKTANANRLVCLWKTINN